MGSRDACRGAVECRPGEMWDMVRAHGMHSSSTNLATMSIFCRAASLTCFETCNQSNSRAVSFNSMA